MRPFRCRYCGHKLRLFGSTCSSCYQPRALHQRFAVWAVGAVLVLGVAAWVLLAA